MQYLVTASQIQSYDSHTIDHIGIPALVLMERAALAVVERLLACQFNLTNVAIVCGYGNNGGDGIAIARLLKLKRIDVTVFLVGNSAHCSVETQQQLNIAHHYHVNITTALPTDNFNTYSTIIDAIFGIGLTRDVTGDFAYIISRINQSQADVMAVDVPSGISADTGKILGTAVKAKQTVTFAYQKLGLTFYPGAEFAGDIFVADIGIYADESNLLSCALSLQSADLLNLLPIRSAYSNKGSFGRVLVIAGSENMSGAAYLSAKSAYRTGAGLVKIYTPNCNRDILLGQLPEALLTPYHPERLDMDQLKTAIDWASVIVIGPGMGMSESTGNILSTVLATANKPIVIDADGLNVLAQHLVLLAPTNRLSEQHIIVTPHLREMARLTSLSLTHIADNLLATAKQFAKQYQVICILKDSRTVTALPCGLCYVNQSGNSGMATGGSGDVLTGIVAGLIAQHLSIETAAPVSAYLHGLAGDFAADEKSEFSLIAEDIINNIGKVIHTISRERGEIDR